MPKEFIVAIELGSSKITGIAGKKNLDGSISVLALVQEDSTACVRNGVVYNIDKTVQCLTSIIKKLETTLKTKIIRVYVGVGGQSIRSVKNNIVKELPADAIVTQDMVNELMDTNRNMDYSEQKILDAATQEYKVDNQYQIDPVGIQCKRLEGNFLNILWRKTFYRNLNKCFENAGINIAEMYLAPLALADSILTETEKRSGCVLVDLGADTTTVAVYYRNILRHLAVIPLGGHNITKDITSLHMEEHDAEQLKFKYGSAYTNYEDIDNSQEIPIDADRKVEMRKFVEIVESRVDEIIENVRFQVPTEYADKLLGGIVLTGGTSNMPHMEEAFRNITHVDKIRTAKFVTATITTAASVSLPHDGTINTVLGLLEKGDMNCAGDPITNDLFQEPSAATSNLAADKQKVTRSLNEVQGEGRVLSEEDMQRSAAEAQRKKEEEERKQREEEERIRREEEAERKRNQPLRKAFRWAKKMAVILVKPEDE